MKKILYRILKKDMIKKLSKKYGEQFIFYIPLVTAGSTAYQSSPTLASGDVTIKKDDGSSVNLAALPTASGVDVKVIMPRHSDVGLIDILRTRYLGVLYKNGIKLMFFGPHNLHAKLILIDKEVYSIGSPNFDYRSFRYQHEIVVVGEEKSVIKQINYHIGETLKSCEEFNYEIWFRRSAFQKFFEWILLPFRHLL